MNAEIVSLDGFDYWNRFLDGAKYFAEMNQAFRNATGYHQYKLGELKGRAEWIATLQSKNAHRVVLQRGRQRVCGCGLVMANGLTIEGSVGHRFEEKVVGLFVTYGNTEVSLVQAHCQGCLLTWSVEPQDWAFGSVPSVNLELLARHKESCANPAHFGQF